MLTPAVGLDPTAVRSFTTAIIHPFYESGGIRLSADYFGRPAFGLLIAHINLE
jgi:hypothetical protein